MFPLFSAVVFLHAPALAEDAQLTDPIAKAPELALRDLVPAAILEAITNPFNLRAEVASNDAGRPFQATFDIALPDYPNVTISLLVSEREATTGLIANILSMAASGNLPGGWAADTEVLADAECVGVVDQNMINCLIGSAAVQFTATDFSGGGSIDYPATKALFATFPLDSYRKAFGQ
ncbi:hypothetical protein EJC49_14280 [Aquibium carbonis]|uniref:Uncharacterized protein n=1 Tax=Aquibium carbonis TaxID=2495581 RepID=A0A429YW64_9HYPH|nr:hypothetical protein [Aquibium carbonis]RST85703.1 hypothetical protein EJC49_14280 [Aquibium carbonis]